MRAATGEDAATRFLEHTALAGTDWRLVSTRQRQVRLDPPKAYWAVHRVRLVRNATPGPGNGEWWDGFDEHRELRLVARGAFERKAWHEYREAVLAPLLRSEEHTSELQSRGHLVCRLLLEKKK